MEDVYDPLDYTNLTRSVVATLLEKPPVAIPPEESFEGAGVYAIYYTGDFSPYSRIASPKYKIPIYVGKAIPTGGRKGQTGITPSTGKELFNRLRQHANSIEQAENLLLEDFKCRYLVVLPVWVSLAEQFLINHYKPVWNVFLEGFGNHDPGKGRKDMKRPAWDVVHPGRYWASKLSAQETAGELLEKLKEFFRQ